MMGLGLAIVGVAVMLAPSLVLRVTGANRQKVTLAALPADAPDRGLIYAGLQRTRTDSLCGGAYLVDAQTCTYGPDAAPAGLRVRNDVPPVTPKAPKQPAPSVEGDNAPSDADVAGDAGATLLTSDAPALIPDAAPGAADFVIGAHNVACEGDGRTGKRVQTLYVHQAGTPSRYGEFLGSIRTWAVGVDKIFDASAAETGGSRHVRYVTTPQCRVDVAEVQLPTGALESFPNTVRALRKLGYNRTDRKYLLFADANVYCGIATFVADRRPGLGNRNNGGPSYGRVDAGCWGAPMAARELVHELGGVLTGAPNANGTGGCLDSYDLLCDVDRAGKAASTKCPKSHQYRLDCGHDDYFSTAAPAGSYLARNFNVATSAFLLRSDGGDDIPDADGGTAPTPTGSPEPSAPAPTTATPTPSETVEPGTGDGDEPGDGEDPGDDGEDPNPTDSSPPTPEPTPSTSATAQPVPTDDVRAPTPADQVQAVLETRDATSSSVRLSWSAFAPSATYEVSVDGTPIATTKATRARLVGLKPDTRVRVTIRSGTSYTARATAQTAPAARPAQNSSFVLTNALTGGAADLYAARPTNGTPLTLAESDGNAQQLWEMTPAGESYLLVSRATGKCVQSLNGVAVAGAPLVQGDCSADAARWSLQASDYGFSLRTTGDLVVGVGKQRFGAHRVLVLQKSTGQRHQSWTAVPD